MVIEKLIKDFDKLSPSERITKLKELEKQIQDEEKRATLDINRERDERVKKQMMEEEDFLNKKKNIPLIQHEENKKVIKKKDEDDQPLEKRIVDDKEMQIPQQVHYEIKMSDNAYEKIQAFTENLYLSKQEETELKNVYAKLHDVKESYLNDNQKRLKDELRRLGSAKEWWEEDKLTYK